MTKDDLLEMLKDIQSSKCETRILEIKAAENGCPKKMYDTLSSFSNQDDGGTIIFGVDEERGFLECGVYDPQDIQKKINEQCLQMEPVVRPLLTVAEKEGKFFVSAEIPGIDLVERPCYYSGRGRLKGSYVRVGDSDEPMTEYEVYSYEAFRKKYQDDVRTVPRATFAVLDKNLLDNYMERLRRKKANLSAIPEDIVYELMSITRDGGITLSSLMLFCRYPQAYFPQLCITAVALPGNELGELGTSGERFLDNERIEGNIPDMLNLAIAFVRRNMRTKTIINPDTGMREDRPDYPITAIRETILNALIHRDYSKHTEGMPIQILMYPDRIEIKNPGGLYGRLKIDELGKKQPDTRNPVLVTAMEILELTENRYSGIPTIRKVMKDAELKEPVFADERGTFVVTMYNTVQQYQKLPDTRNNSKQAKLLYYLETPRSRQEIADYLGIGTVSYAIQTYINPLVEDGLVKLTIPEKPKSQNQKYVRSTQSKVESWYNEL